MGEVGFSIEERFYNTVKELEYSDLEHLDGVQVTMVEDAIILLYGKLYGRDYEFTDEEREELEEAFALIGE